MLYIYLVVLGFMPALLMSRGLPMRRDVVCSSSAVPDEGQTCESFAQSLGLDVDSFKELNPDAQCPDLDTTKEYCASGTDTPSSSATSTGSATSKLSTTIPPTAPSSPIAAMSASEHEPEMPGLASNCDGFHKVASGDRCDLIENTYGISNSQFMQWNSFVNDACSNLWLDYYVCVHVTEATATVPSGSSPTATNSPSPQMPGIVGNCKEYYMVVAGDTCFEIEQEYGISLSQLTSWNGELNEGCTNLWVDYYICVCV